MGFTEKRKMYEDYSKINNQNHFSFIALGFKILFIDLLCIEKKSKSNNNLFAKELRKIL